MTIKFKILWFEDDDDLFEASQELLEDHLDQLGFNLKIKRVKTPNEQSIDNDLDSTSEYDLLLVDLNYTTEPNQADAPFGEIIIKKIKDRQPFSEVIFYSGSNHLHDIISKNKIEGVYISNKNIAKKAVKLIDFQLRKNLHPERMRSVVVAGITEIDKLCYDVIKAKYNKQPDQELKDKFVLDLKKSLKDKDKKRCKNIEKILKKSNIEFLTAAQSTLILESMHRVDKVIKFAKDDGYIGDDLLKIEELKKAIGLRNKLAHWPIVEISDTKVTLQDEGNVLEFDLDSATIVRKQINAGAKKLREYIGSI